ncbi:hypothetical protein BJX65DRAFT_260940 [Aspergillus insuetus]
MSSSTEHQSLAFLPCRLRRKEFTIGDYSTTLQALQSHSSSACFVFVVLWYHFDSSHPNYLRAPCYSFDRILLIEGYLSRL